MNAIFEDILKAAKDKKLIAFCGAGISMLPPSNSPSWWSIYYAAASALRDRFEEGFAEIKYRIPLEKMLKPFSTQQLADTIISEFAGNTFLDVLRVVDVADSNENHVLLTVLAAKGYLNGIITTNWDTILERTAAINEFNYLVVTPTLFPEDSNTISVPLIKLHGSAIDSPHMKETIYHKAKVTNTKLRNSWFSLIKDKNLLVLGFGGADIELGAVHSFFEDFLKEGGNIWWLHLKGKLPTLPEYIRQRVILIESELPNFLVELAKGLNESGFKTPVTGRDAMFQLQEVMHTWSNKPHIGKWAAAKFFLALITENKANKNELKELQAILMQLAKESANFINDAVEYKKEINLLDATTKTIFLSRAGMISVRTTKFLDATKMLRAVVNIHENWELIRKNQEDNIASRLENLTNLSSAWANYASALQLNGSSDEALNGFVKSFKYSYLAGNASSFLISLYSILNYGFELSNIRATISLAEGGIKLADREGAIQSSIELRLLLICYRICRNEINIADELLIEAKWFAKASNNSLLLFVFECLSGYTLIKRNKIEKGLTKIADSLCELESTCLYLLPIEELRRFLLILGIPSDMPFAIEMTHADIPAFSQIINDEILQAKADRRLPWHGAHCKIEESAGIDKEDLFCLYFSGASLFQEDYVNRITKALSHATVCANQRKWEDAVWWISEVMSMTDIEMTDLIFAKLLFAELQAQLGNLQEADRHYSESLKELKNSSTNISLTLVMSGFWFYVQFEDVNKAAEWLKLLVSEIKKMPDSDGFQKQLLLDMKTHRATLKDISSQFETEMKIDPVVLDEMDSLVLPSDRPYLYFTGIRNHQDYNITTEKLTKINEVKAKIKDGNQAEALKLIDELTINEESGLSYYQFEIMINIKFDAFLISNTIQELNKKLEELRLKFLSDFKLTHLCIMELVLMNLCIKFKDIVLAENLRQSFNCLIEFVDDPFIKCRSAYLGYIIEGLISNKHELPAANSLVVKTARFFRVPEFNFSVNLTNQTIDTFCKKLINDFIASLNEVTDREQLNNVLELSLQKINEIQGESTFCRVAITSATAHHALIIEDFHYAIERYEEVKQLCKQSNDLNNWLNAMAGIGRAYSRNKMFLKAKQIFEEAIEKAQTSDILHDLLSGLAAAYMIEATESNCTVVIEKINEAIKIYDKIIKSSNAGSLVKAYARLGLARAYGQSMQQSLALRSFDEAVSELAHNGSSATKVLLENRHLFEQGKWEQLGLH